MLETIGVVTLITLIIVSSVIGLEIRKASPSATITRKLRLEHPERIKLKR